MDEQHTFSSKKCSESKDLSLRRWAFHLLRYHSKDRVVEFIYKKAKKLIGSNSVPSCISCESLKKEENFDDFQGALENFRDLLSTSLLKLRTFNNQIDVKKILDTSSEIQRLCDHRMMRIAKLIDEQKKIVRMFNEFLEDSPSEKQIAEATGILKSFAIAIRELLAAFAQMYEHSMTSCLQAGKIVCITLPHIYQNLNLLAPVIEKAGSDHLWEGRRALLLFKKFKHGTLSSAEIVKECAARKWDGVVLYYGFLRNLFLQLDEVENARICTDGQVDVSQMISFEEYGTLLRENESLGESLRAFQSEKPPESMLNEIVDESLTRQISLSVVSADQRVLRTVDICRGIQSMRKALISNIFEYYKLKAQYSRIDTIHDKLQGAIEKHNCHESCSGITDENVLLRIQNSRKRRVTRASTLEKEVLDLQVDLGSKECLLKSLVQGNAKSRSNYMYKRGHQPIVKDRRFKTVVTVQHNLDPPRFPFG